MKAILRILVMVVLSVLLVTLAFGAGYASSGFLMARSQPVAASGLNDGAPAEFQPSMPVFWEAWKIVKDNFFTAQFDDEKLTYGAIGGMVDSLGDPHTAFVDPKVAAFVESEVSGEFEGIGATVEMRDGRLTIVAPLKGTPADKAGLQPGDVIVQVDDTVIQNMDVYQAISLIRGKRGTTVRLKVQRGANPAFEVSIVRDRIQSPIVQTKWYENDTIAYVQLTDFTATSTNAVRRALQDVLAKNPKGLIFDVRGNPGGLLDAAVKITSEFIGPAKTVVVEATKDGKKEKLPSIDGGVGTQVPMVLLINNGSASASEILAAAVKDYGRATLIGKTTYGKGSVQLPHVLSDNSQLRITIAHFLSPMEHEINGIGISPDIEVENPNDFERSRGVDPQLDRALEYIKNGARLQPSTRPSAGQTLLDPALSPAALMERVWAGLNESIFAV